MTDNQVPDSLFSSSFWTTQKHVNHVHIFGEKIDGEWTVAGAQVECEAHDVRATLNTQTREISAILKVPYGSGYVLADMCYIREREAEAVFNHYYALEQANENGVT